MYFVVPIVRLMFDSLVTNLQFMATVRNEAYLTACNTNRSLEFMDTVRNEAYLTACNIYKQKFRVYGYS